MGIELFYWFFVSLSFFYIFYKNYYSLINVLIILCFYSGLASFLGKGFENPYKVLLVLYSLYVFIRYNGLSKPTRSERFLIFIFILFSLSFIYSAILNGDYFTLVFSQYGKFITPICLFFIFNRITIKNPLKIDGIKKLLISLLTIQIILSLTKVLTIGLRESTVGSLTWGGGGPAAVLPVLGFILFWLHKQGSFKIKDWIYIFLLLFIGFASLKRAIWFIMPAIIFLFMNYVPKRVKLINLISFLPLLPIIFYMGVRLNSSLNKEGIIGGSFDMDYVISYAKEYSFGDSEESPDIEVAQGRGGATILIWEKLADIQSLSENDFWGFGLQEYYTVDYAAFDEEKFGVSGKGDVTGVFQSYISTGFVGIFFSLLFIFSILACIKVPRIRVAIALFMFWDYFFYSGLILRVQALSILLFFIITYVNIQYDENKKNKYIGSNTQDDSLKLISNKT